MNSLERSIILKAGYDNGWEVRIDDAPARVVLASALHKARVQIESSPPGCRWIVRFTPEQLRRELERDMGGHVLTDKWFGTDNEAELARLLSHAARLARALPDEPSRRFEKEVRTRLAAIDPIKCSTEVERLVRQRVGQEVFRQGLLDYWGSACAVTGIAVPELLRASHAKPWAKCETDVERLNVFNGFLLVANLDALFDRYMMTFDDDGAARFSPRITEEVRRLLGLERSVRLRWVSDDHRAFLAHHRAEFDASLKLDASQQGGEEG
jgi:hypothetical protein